LVTCFLVACCIDLALYEMSGWQLAVWSCLIQALVKILVICTLIAPTVFVRACYLDLPSMQFSMLNPNLVSDLL